MPFLMFLMSVMRIFSFLGSIGPVYPTRLTVARVPGSTTRKFSGASERGNFLEKVVVCLVNYFSEISFQHPVDELRNVKFKIT